METSCEADDDKMEMSQGNSANDGGRSILKEDDGRKNITNEERMNPAQCVRESKTGNKFKEDSDFVTTSVSSQIHDKPGVILLGRGNSFSLGRSEVILLHRRPKSSTLKTIKRSPIASGSEESIVNRSDKSSSLQTVVEQRSSSVGEDSHDSVLLPTAESDESTRQRPSPSPPPISNGLSCHSLEIVDGKSDAVVNESSGHVLDLLPCYEDELVDLWHKTESLMIARQDKVLKILEKFGIGGPGGGGGEADIDWEEEGLEERRKEEDDVWQIIQDNFRA